MLTRGTLLAFTFSGLLLAQRQPDGSSPDREAVTKQPGILALPAHDASTQGPSSSEWKGLTTKEKLSYDWRHLFDVENVVFVGLGAGIDQWRDRPGEWGQGWGPYFGRYGSHLAQYVGFNAASCFQCRRSPMRISRINVYHEFTPDMKRWLHLTR